MNAASLQDRVVEFFTLREAGRQLAAIPEETRSSVYRDLRIAFQRREAAETLWPRGSTAEALQLAVEALELARSSLAAFPAEPRPSWLADAQAVAAEASKRLADVRLPVLEADTLPSHDEVFRAIVDAIIAIEELAGVSLAAPADLRRIRSTRIAAAAFALVVVVAGTARALHTPAFSRAAASGQYDGESGPEKAYDGEVGSAWILPDRVSQGWLELTLSKPRAIHAIHIVPSNPPYNDRDVKDARIDAMLEGVIVKSVDVTFPEPVGKEPSWNDVILDAPKCDHLRITAKSNYRQGVSIAEIELK